MQSMLLSAMNNIQGIAMIEILYNHGRGEKMSKRQILNGRVATKEDFEAGNVIFYIHDSHSVPYSFGRELPLAARIVKPDLGDGFPPPGTPVTIVQAEITDDKHVTLGVIFGDDDEGICDLEDVQL
jgi:hypothetical protein